MGSNISLRFAWDYNMTDQERRMVRLIVASACEVLGIRWASVLGRNRTKRISEVRHWIAGMLRDDALATEASIVRILRRDRTAVRRAFKQYEGYLQTSEGQEMRAMIENVFRVRNRCTPGEPESTGWYSDPDFPLARNERLHGRSA